MPEAPQPTPNPQPEDSATTDPQTPEQTEETTSSTTPETPPEVMPGASEDDLRAEVRRLRDEAAEQRVKGRRSETLSARLVTAYAAATGLLADPDDLRADPADLVDDDGLPDPGKVRAAVETLIEAKPHLASRTPRGDIDQGARDDENELSLSEFLRRGA